MRGRGGWGAAVAGRALALEEYESGLEVLWGSELVGRALLIPG